MKNGRELIFIFASGYVCYLSVQIIATLQEEQPSNQTVLTLVAVVMLLAGITLILINGISLFKSLKFGNDSPKEENELVSLENDANTEKMDVVDDLSNQDTVKMPKGLFNREKK